MICKFTTASRGICLQSVFGRWTVNCIRFLNGLVLIFCWSTGEIYWVVFRHFFLVTYVYKTKNLGVTFNYDLSWGDHIRTICHKVYGALTGFRWLMASPPPVAVSMRLIVTCCPGDSSFHLLRLCLLCTWLLFTEEFYSGFNACVRYDYQKKFFADLHSILNCNLHVFASFHLSF
jgi:hypothetical protein